MPKRSTPFQAIVRLVREHFAQPGVVVTESKHLLDAVTGYSPEVDVVIEGELDGEPIVISVEVIERSRRASVEWVQQMLRKHQNLPTNRLILVSKSGFSRQSLVLVEKEAGRVQALTPELVNGDSVVRHLYVDQLGAEPTGCKVHLIGEAGPIAVQCEHDTGVYAEDGKLVGPLHRLVREILNHPDVVKHLSATAHNHPEREEMKGFSAGFPIVDANYCLLEIEIDKLQKISAIETWGKFAWTQTEVRFVLNRLGGRVYGADEVPIAGRPAVWVSTTDQSQQTTKISWQWTDTSPAPAVTEEAQEDLFPAIRDLTFPGPPSEPPVHNDEDDAP